MAQLGRRGVVSVSRLGKWKTAAQMTALLLLLYRDPLWGLPVIEIGQVLLLLAAGLTLWSMIRYLNAAWPVLKQST